MDEFQFPEDITSLSADELAASEQAAIAAFDALRATGDDLTDEQVDQMEALAAHVAAVRAEGERRETAASERRARIEAAAESLSTEPAEEQGEEGEEQQGEEEVEEQQPEDSEHVEEAAAVTAAAPTTTKRRAPSLVRAAPKRQPVRPKAGATAVLTAAADIPGVPAGSQYDDLMAVAKAFIARSKAFPQTAPGKAKSAVRHQYGIATFSRGDGAFEGLSDSNPDYGDQMELLAAAAKESRLPGGSLTASGGWCAPSETLYDLCAGRESLDGLWDVPEINVTRGGIRYTRGLDFGDMLDDESFAGSGNGFWLTEAQAIAGVSKTCFEVTCPEFEEVRLDAVGLCIKAPILTNTAYPELVRRWIEGSLVAHQHRVSGALLARAETALGPAVPAGHAGGAAWSTLTALELVCEGLRQRERMSFGSTMEVVVPNWIKVAIRGDLANRTGQPFEAVTDQQITAHFSARNLRVQFVYNWHGLRNTGSAVVDFPDTVPALVYPAGKFVKGTEDVITLDTVYDSTDLLANMYTATFMEEGVLLAEQCGNGYVLELPVCVSGQTGAADLSTCFGGTDSLVESPIIG